MKINRYDYATAIPLLQKMMAALDGKTDQLKKLTGEVSGQKMYRVDIIASQGNLLRGGIDSTTLIARLSSWDKDITESVDKNAFVWTRNSGDADVDLEWNNAHAYGEKYVKIMKEDVANQATFFCSVNTPEGIQADAQITIVNYSATEETQADISRINSSVADLQKNTSEMGGNIASLNDRANENAEAVGDIRAMFVGLESTVESIDKNKASLEDLAGVLQKFNEVLQKTPEGLKIIGVDDLGQQSIINLLLKHDRLMFQENGVTVAYISNENLNIENAVIRNRLTVGNHEITTDGDSFELVYVGEQ